MSIVNTRGSPIVFVAPRALVSIARIGDLSGIATREQLPRSYVQAHLLLALLAPRIIQAILDGKQPADLTLMQLMYRTDLSTDWASQARQLGFLDRVPRKSRLPARETPPNCDAL